MDGWDHDIYTHKSKGRDINQEDKKMAASFKKRKIKVVRVASDPQSKAIVLTS